MATINCARCQQNLPGLAAPPFSNALGKRIYEQTCQACWKAWLATQNQLINHYGLNLRDPAAQWPGIDPEGWARERKYNERGLGESVERFLKERRASLAWLKGIGEADWARAHAHPALGSLRAGDLMGSWAAHDWLHLRQIAKRRYELAARDAEGFGVGYAGKWGA